MKRLGIVDADCFEIKEWSMKEGWFELTITECNKKSVKIKIRLWQIKLLSDCLHYIVKKIRQYGVDTFNQYYDLRDKTGCPKTEGDPR